MSFDKLVSKIASFGITGIVLLVALSVTGASTGLAGGALIMSTLASFGFGGVIGGVLTITAIGIIAAGISTYGFEKIFYAVINKIKEDEDLTTNEMIDRIRKMKFISKSLKGLVIEKLKDSEKDSSYKWDYIDTNCATGYEEDDDTEF